MSPERLERADKRYGFTLVELMVVVLILGILATITTIKVADYLVKSKQTKARTDLATLKNALELWRLEYDRYPTAEEGLDVLSQRTEQHPDGLLEAVPLDPWGHPYDYIIPGAHGSYDLICYGRDGLEAGTRDDADIGSWELVRPAP